MTNWLFLNENSIEDSVTKIAKFFFFLGKKKFFGLITTTFQQVHGINRRINHTTMKCETLGCFAKGQTCTGVTRTASICTSFWIFAKPTDNSSFQSSKEALPILWIPWFQGSIISGPMKYVKIASKGFFFFKNKNVFDKNFVLYWSFKNWV